jgi:hypothetical protein
LRASNILEIWNILVSCYCDFGTNKHNGVYENYLLIKLAELSLLTWFLYWNNTCVKNITKNLNHRKDYTIYILFWALLTNRLWLQISFVGLIYDKVYTWGRVYNNAISVYFAIMMLIVCTKRENISQEKEKSIKN